MWLIGIDYLQEAFRFGTIGKGTVPVVVHAMGHMRQENLHVCTLLVNRARTASELVLAIGTIWTPGRMPQQDQLLRSPFVICTFGSGSGASRDPGLFRHVRSTGHTGHGGSYRTTTVSIRSSTCCNGGSRGSCIGTRTGSCSCLSDDLFLLFCSRLTLASATSTRR